MDKVYEISLLMDFYGQLLTKKQYDMMDLHFNNDYSFGEIAEHMDISRQGVYEHIKKGKITLLEMEEKLGLVKKFSRQRQKANEILEYLKKISENPDGTLKKTYLNKIKNLVVDILED